MTRHEEVPHKREQSVLPVSAGATRQVSSEVTLDNPRFVPLLRWPSVTAETSRVTLPNLITVGRFFLTPLTVYLLLTGYYGGAFAAFVIAGISDALDGFIAKNFDLRSELGAYMDPLADKALLVSIYVVLGWLGHLPIWLVVAVVSRDLLIVGAVLLSWVMQQPVAMSPLFVSKANTATQIVLAALVLAERAFEFSLDPTVPLLTFAVAGLTLASAGAYLIAWSRHMTSTDRS